MVASTIGLTALVIATVAVIALIILLVWFIARPVRKEGIIVRMPARRDPRWPDWNWPPRPTNKEQHDARD